MPALYCLLAEVTIGTVTVIFASRDAARKRRKERTQEGLGPAGPDGWQPYRRYRD